MRSNWFVLDQTIIQTFQKLSKIDLCGGLAKGTTVFVCLAHGFTNQFFWPNQSSQSRNSPSLPMLSVTGRPRGSSAFCGSPWGSPPSQAHRSCARYLLHALFPSSLNGAGFVCLLLFRLHLHPLVCNGWMALCGGKIWEMLIRCFQKAPCLPKKARRFFSGCRKCEIPYLFS